MNSQAGFKLLPGINLLIPGGNGPQGLTVFHLKALIGHPLSVIFNFWRKLIEYIFCLKPPQIVKKLLII